MVQLWSVSSSVLATFGPVLGPIPIPILALDLNTQAQIELETQLRP